MPATFTLPPSALAPLSKSQIKNFYYDRRGFFDSRHKLTPHQEPDLFRERLARLGDQVEELARQRYPGGVLVQDEYWEIEKAAQTTQELLVRPEVPAIFEAGFFVRGNDNPLDLGVGVRADVLERVPAAFIEQSYTQVEAFARSLLKIFKKARSFSVQDISQAMDEAFKLEQKIKGLYHLKQRVLLLKMFVVSHLAFTHPEPFIKEQLRPILEMARGLENDPGIPLADEYEKAREWLEYVVEDTKRSVNRLQASGLEFLKSSLMGLMSERQRFINEGLFDMLEVKSISGVFDDKGDIQYNKKSYVLDLAIQVYVAENAGLNLNQAGIMHVSANYVHPQNGFEYDPQTFLAKSLLTDRVREMHDEVRGLIDEAMAVAVDPNQPVVKETGPTHISQLYGMRTALYERLIGAGITDLTDPAFFEKIDQYNARVAAFNRLIDEYNKERPKAEQKSKWSQIRLNAIQKRHLMAVRTGQLVIDRQGLKGALEKIKHPVHNMDFETFHGPFPVFAGMRPFMENPLQVSNHIRHADGTLEHREFLTSGDLNKDLLREFAEELIAMMDGEGSILVYNAPFEKKCLDVLIERYPDLAEALQGIKARIVDLYQIIKDHVYHPDFGNSLSIKNVLPALVPEFSYKGMTISNGAEAVVAIEKLLNPNVSQKEKDKTRAHLLEYCGLDSFAMVKIYEVLVDLVSQPEPEDVRTKAF